MKTLSEKLNFSDKPNNKSVRILKNHRLSNYEDYLWSYVDRNNLDMREYSDEEIQNAVEIMHEHGTAVDATNDYHFWIDHKLTWSIKP